jgi:serine phosphatase RsbU (regulator of sigma subunit)/pSer/pThr/pTyr-binding forkhead associated (FHA) protein
VSQADQVHFTVYQPNLAPMHVALDAQTITLGRASECTIPIRDRFLSRRHAEINFAAGEWVVRDCGSVNGTLLNGTKLASPTVLRPGDRISLGDSEVVFHATAPDTASRIIPVDSSSAAKNLAVPMRLATDEAELASRGDGRGRERAHVLTSLALEFIADRPMSELFDYILERVDNHMSPSRTALALLAEDGKTFANVHMRRRDKSDSADLTISRTLLGEVVEERNVVAYVDTDQDEKLARAESIIGQHIRSAVCAPLLVGEQVLGVLYLEFLANRGAVTHDDVRLIAQIARFAAAKLETTRLREESMAKAKLDEELRTAYKIQSRLLPDALPDVEGYRFAGTNKPCRTVSGDYYDVVVRPDGRIYFVIADVSGKGITAALVMSGLATAFNIFTRTDPAPSELVRELNLTLAPKTAPTKFATLVAGVLDPSTGRVDFTNAGHVPPLVISKNGTQTLGTTDLVVGLFTHAQYHTQSIMLDPGDTLVLFTDGVTEAENDKEEQLGLPRIATLLDTMHGKLAPLILETIDQNVREFCGGIPANDDVTSFAVTRMN